MYSSKYEEVCVRTSGLHAGQQDESGQQVQGHKNSKINNQIVMSL